MEKSWERKAKEDSRGARRDLAWNWNDPQLLGVPAEAESSGPGPRLAEPAVRARARGGRRRRRGAAQHLPHHLHVLVLARAHLLPQPPQPGLADPEAGGDAEPDAPHRP